MSTNACTIIARNYLPAARVLASSFSAHHRDANFSVLIIDENADQSGSMAEPFEIITPEQLDIDRAELLRMAAIYNVMEFSTAIKPWFLQYLLDRGADSVIYLDPDIEVFASLDPISALTETNNIVLTPHVVQPLPRDDRSPSESEILASGIYNLGFIALSRSEKAFLEFWKVRLARECLSDPLHMRFVDQRWVDFVPGIFGAYVLRDPGYNVAYWNLDHRRITIDGSTLQVNGSPLRFFHFSGYDPRVRHLLSKHQGQHPRILLSERNEVKELCDAYGDKLIAAGYCEFIDTPYGFSRLAGGITYGPVMRKLYRDALVRSEKSHQERPPNPFDQSSTQLFVDWLNQAPDDPKKYRLTRYLDALYASRPDLQDVFPDPNGKDFERFSGWAVHEVAENRLDHRLSTLDGSSSPVAELDTTAGRGDDRPAPGIRVAGYFSAETGVGEQGRLALETARQAEITTSTYLDTNSPSRQHHAFVSTKADNLNVNLVCVNADELPNFAKRVGDSFFKDRYTIGLWAWELEEFPPQFRRAFDFVDEIWTSSEFVRASVAAVTEKPVFAFQIPIVAPKVSTEFSRAQYGFPEGFMFLFCFDLESIPERKNPFGLIEAFDKAFARHEGSSLVIKAVNAERRIADLERLKFAAKKRDDVVIFDQYLDADVNAALIDSCDCYVSLHRSEGFGLTLGEAMALGKPAIATAYSGNLDYMNASNSFLVPWSYGTVPAGCEPYPQGTRWADPDIDEAARLMRFVYEHPEEAKKRAELGQKEVLSTHGVNARLQFVKERFAFAQDAITHHREFSRSDSPIRGMFRRLIGGNPR